MNSGIYAIKNILNGHYYVGSTGNLSERWKQHYRSLRRNTHANSYLQNAWNKYGEDNFIHEIVEKCDPDLLMERETYWIKELRSHKDDRGYNFSLVPMATRLGCKARPETIEKMKLSLSGKNHPNWGKKLSPSHIENISKSQTGIPKPMSGSRKQYEIIDPSGIIVRIVGLRKFCRDRGLKHTSIWRVIVGKQEEYNGWKTTIKINSSNYKTPITAICNNEEYNFDSMMDAVRSNVFDFPIYQQNISMCCKNNLKSCGKIHGEKVYWRFNNL